jgi:hypothetical protein
MNDITILDLFWLILTLLVALAMVGLIVSVLALIWAGIKRVAGTVWDILHGRNASVTATIIFVFAVIGCF